MVPAGPSQMERNKHHRQLSGPRQGLLLADSQGTILYVDDAAAESLALQKDEWDDTNLREMLIKDQDDTFSEFMHITKSRHEKSLRQCRVFLKGPLNSTHPADLIAISPGKGKTRLILGLLRSTPDMAGPANDQDGSTADYLRDKLQEERELSELKSRFLTIASHEFKTPLTGILSSLNLIDRYIHADKKNWHQFLNQENVVNHLGKIKESADNLSGTLNKFLSLDAIEKGKIPIKFTDFDLKKVLDAQRKQLQPMCKPGQRIHHLHKSGQTIVHLDKYLLKHIMNNLLTNAIKFSPYNKDITIVSEVRDGTIRIEVIDQGMGIPAPEQGKIFRRFYRAENAMAAQEGTGLGLSIVKRYVGLMGGHISFTSEVNKGSTFTITLPNKLTDEKDPGH